MNIKQIAKTLLKPLVYIGLPLTYLSALWLKFVIKTDEKKASDKIFMKLGILPVLDHYYQPMINPKKHLTKSLREDRDLEGINYNEQEQLLLLSKFNYNAELLEFPLNKRKDLEYYYKNDTFSYGDAEYLYNIVRYFKPNTIIEIGSGFSTLMVQNAIGKNKTETLGYLCKHICVEPYEQPWLEGTGVELIRKKVETIDKSFFQQLEPNDILFIDSSHIIRPQGDVLFEYLELLPRIKSGVLVHVHDIFTPKDYPAEWVCSRHLLWNEQYLLEAFLTLNHEFRIIGALHYLSLNHKKEFSDKCPVFKKQPDGRSSSFWMIKN